MLMTPPTNADCYVCRECTGQLVQPRFTGRNFDCFRIIPTRAVFEVLFGLEDFDALSNHDSEVPIVLQGVPDTVLQILLRGGMDKV